MGDYLLDAVVELLGMVPLFGQGRLIAAGAHHEERAGQSETELWSLSGAEALRFSPAPAAEGHHGLLASGHLYLRVDGFDLDLHPLLVAEPAPPEAAVLFLSRTGRRHVAAYLDYATGRTTSLPLLAEDHRRLLATILGRPVSAPEIEALGDRSLHDSPEDAIQETEVLNHGASPSPAERVGPYTIIRELGRGGQAVVYLAEDTRLGRKVALKVLTGVGPLPDDVLRRFRREAEVTSRLDHRGICPLYDAGQEGGIPYIAMRYVEGETLARKIAKAREGPGAGESTVRTAATQRLGHDPESPHEAFEAENGDSTQVEIDSVLRLVESAARALHAAHEAGVVHRDVKPGNIMIGSDGEPVVLDFGLARADDEAFATLTRTGDLFGTPAYMSPEQIAAHRIVLDRRTDIWSLGVSLYECLSFRRPFEAATREGLYQQILNKEPLEVRHLNPRISRDLTTVVQTAIEKDRDRRYQTALDFAEDLRRVREHEPVAARPVSRWTKLVRWAQRNPAVASLLVAVIVSLSGGLVTAWILKDRADNNAAVALEQRDRADANAAEVTRKNQEIQLSADAGEAATLLDLAENKLWPALPERVHDLEAWLARAVPIVDRLPRYRRELEEMQATAPPLAGAALAQEEVAHAAERAELQAVEAEETEKGPKEAEDEKEAQARLAAAEKALADPKVSDARRERAHSVKAEAAEAEGALSGVRGTRAAREQKKRELEGRLQRRLTWAFPDSAVQAHHDRLTEAVSRIESLVATRSDLPGIWSIEGRLRFSSTLEQRTVEDHRAAWNAAIARVASNSRYKGLKLAPHVGLIPLGPDPASTLEEFSDTATGEVPARNAEGKLLISEQTAVVFVLVPGGRFMMGAQKSNSKGENYDPQAGPSEGPVHSVTLPAFLLSKDEMTQGQWLRLTGENPSRYRPENSSGVTLRNPVERVSWEDCHQVVAKLGWSLPSEAQWECGCRAGTSDPWWSGRTSEDLARVANLADADSREHGGPSGLAYEPWSDGYAIHAPVGMLRANGFGLHDVHGNVYEWCEDRWHDNYEGAPTDGHAWLSGASYRMFRGGSFLDAAAGARSAVRAWFIPGYSLAVLGLRPARALAP